MSHIDRWCHGYHEENFRIILRTFTHAHKKYSCALWMAHIMQSRMACVLQNIVNCCWQIINCNLMPWKIPISFTLPLCTISMIFRMTSRINIPSSICQPNIITQVIQNVTYKWIVTLYWKYKYTQRCDI